MQLIVTVRLVSRRIRHGVMACVFGFGAAACQSATNGAGTDSLRHGGEHGREHGPDVASTEERTRAQHGNRAIAPASSASGSVTRQGVAVDTHVQVEPAPNSDVIRVPQRLHELTIESALFGNVPVLVRVPAHRFDERLPVLFVLHGRGEAVKGPERGVRAFLDDYRLERVWAWLETGTSAPLPDASITDGYRKVVQRKLEARRFRGMIVVMPYLPDRFKATEAFANAKPYADVLRETAIRLRRSFPVAAGIERWALDGISLGGRVALLSGPELTDVFGAIGGVQAAIDEREFDTLLEHLTTQPGTNTQRLFLATSEQDYYRSVLHTFHERLTRDQLPHTFTLLPGDHSYSFNRGPGLTYLLLTYDALLNP